MLTRDEAKERVAQGAAHLDRVFPGWEDRIDVGTLEMRHGCRCIVGQLIGDFNDYRGLEQLGVLATHVEYGLNLDTGTMIPFAASAPVTSPLSTARDESEDAFKRRWAEARQSEWSALQDAWIEEIADRRLGSAQAIEQPASCDAVREDVGSPVVCPRV